MEIPVRTVLIFLAYFIPQCFGQQLSIEECQRPTDECQADFNRAIQQPLPIQTICGQARLALQCVKELDCESEMFLRIAFRRTRRRLHDLRIDCELGSYFEQDKALTFDCTQKVEDCTYLYVDRLLQQERQPAERNATVLCLDLDTFASCRLRSMEECGIDKEEIVDLVEKEKIRQEIPDCFLPSINLSTRAAVSLTTILATLMAALSLKR